MIFALYLIFLAGFPCNDGNTCVDEKKSGIQTSYSSHEHSSETGGTLAPALPDEAIIDYQGKKYIFIAKRSAHDDEAVGEAAAENGEHEHEEGEHFRMLEVETGASELGYTELRVPKGFDQNTRVVVRGAYAILSKMKNSEEAGHAR
jgi:cobalt-zinc-cadmium efflux system membrane fusion protein